MKIAMRSRASFRIALLNLVLFVLIYRKKFCFRSESHKPNSKAVAVFIAARAESIELIAESSPFLHEFQRFDRSYFDGEEVVSPCINV